MKLYKINSEYLNYLKIIDQNVLYNTTLGTIIRLNSYIYFLPIESLDSTDYENDSIKKNNPVIMRFYNQISSFKCLLSNMIPVSYNDLYTFTYSDEINKNIRILLEKNEDRIIKSALRIYNQKSKNYQQNYLLNTVNFNILEKSLIQWEEKKYGKHINRFPDDKYFLVNHEQGISNYYLMNKNTKVLMLSYDNTNSKIINIIKIFNENYAPLETFDQAKHITCELLNEWFRGRGIPSWRDGLDDMLDNLGISNKDQLLNKSFGLSLSDQYWMNPVENSLTYQQINFFTNDFDSNNYLKAIFKNEIVNSEETNLYTPNNTSEGMLKKTWVIGDDHIRYLLKGRYHDIGTEPFNEILGTMISQAIDLPYVKYSIENIGNQIVSKCPCFINENQEFISAYAICRYEQIDLKKPALDIYHQYLNALTKHGIKDHISITKMFILDYLMVNTDRHLGNFGIIRDVNTLEWLSISPNFDNGMSMYSLNQIYEFNSENAYGTFFTDKNCNFETILHSLNQIKELNIDFDSLNQVSCEWKNILLKYVETNDISLERVNALIDLLNRRIQKLKDLLLN